MSTNTATAETDDRSPYTRRNWWGEDEETSLTESGHDELSGTTREAFVAHGLLKKTGTMLDPVSLTEAPTEADLHDEKGEQIELSDPEVYVSKRHDGEYGDFGYRQFRHRLRVSEKHGYLCFGGIIADRPIDEFMTVVTEAVENIKENDLAPRQQREIKKIARKKKQCGDLHDTQIMRWVVRAIDNPSSVLND